MIKTNVRAAASGSLGLSFYPYTCLILPHYMAGKQKHGAENKPPTKYHCETKQKLYLETKI